MTRNTKKILMSGLAASFLTLNACSNFNAVGGETRARAANWGEATHSDNVPPNYDVVFQENKVHRMDITITARDWQLMQDNMTELFGEPGSRTGPGGRPGFGGQPGERPGFELPEGLPEGWRPGDEVPEGVTLPEGFPTGPGERPEGGPPGGAGPGGGGGNLQFSEENPIYRPATVTYEGKTWEHVGVRFKGNSSLNSSWGNTLKLPLRFDFDEFEDTYKEINDQRFYGFKRLSLSSGFTDDSLIREKMAADIFREGGVPAARTAFYRIYVDYGEGSKYWGLYTLVEIPDKPMFQTQFKQDSGNLYKPEGTGAQFTTFNQDSFPIKTNEESATWSDIQAVFKALHADRTDAAKWRAGLEAVFDVDGFLRYLAINNLIQNWDSYGAMAHNYYLYNDPGDNLVHWIPWDHNMSLGGGMGGGGRFGEPPNANPNTPTASETTPQPPVSNAQGFPGRPGGGGPGRGVSVSMSEVGEQWPLIRFLADDPVYLETYKAHLKKAMAGCFEKTATENRFRQAHDLIRPYVVGAEGEQEDATLLSSPEGFESAISTLVEHIATRHKAAEDYLTGADSGS